MKVAAFMCLYHFQNVFLAKKQTPKQQSEEKQHPQTKQKINQPKPKPHKNVKSNCSHSCSLCIPMLVCQKEGFTDGPSSHVPFSVWLYTFSVAFYFWLNCPREKLQ